MSENYRGAATSDASELVERIANEIFHGVLPDDPVAICCAVVSTCLPAETRLEVVGAFALDLLLSLRARIAWQNSRWQQ